MRWNKEIVNSLLFLRDFNELVLSTDLRKRSFDLKVQQRAFYRIGCACLSHHRTINSFISMTISLTEIIRSEWCITFIFSAKSALTFKLSSTEVIISCQLQQILNRALISKTLLKLDDDERSWFDFRKRKKKNVCHFYNWRIKQESFLNRLKRMWCDRMHVTPLANDTIKRWRRGNKFANIFATGSR